VVVYGSHGIGRVRARQKRTVFGVEREMVELELADGMRVTLPIGRAQEQLRPLASESDLRRVQETLRGGQPLGPESWSKRLKGARKKLTEGDPIALAELVRDGAHRDRSRSGKGANSRLSTSEDELSARARELLAAEVALARGVRRAEADAWIEEHLSKAADGTVS
jgi:RNA polymerase-interacting CarD/CdnL/TRCF family regulator